MIAAIIFVLAIASQGLVSVQSAPVDAVDAKAVCEDEATISTLGELEILAGQLHDESVECAKHVRDAILTLEDIVAKGSGDACSGEHIDELYDFIVERIIKAEEALPESIELFAKSYAMEVSRGCKNNMIKVLTTEADSFFKPADYEAVDKFAQKGYLLDEVFGSGATDKVTLPTNILYTVTQDGGLQIPLNTDHSNVDELRNLLKTCVTRFSPFFKATLEPVYKLGAAGFEYPDAKTLEEAEISEQHRKKLNHFNIIVSICSSIEMLAETNEELNLQETEDEAEFEPLLKTKITENRILSAEQLESLVESRMAEQVEFEDNLFETVLEHLKKKGYSLEQLDELVQCPRETPAAEQEDGLEEATDVHVKKSCGNRRIPLVLFTAFIFGIFSIGSFVSDY